MKIVCRVKFRVNTLIFGIRDLFTFERVIPIDGEVWRFVKEHVVRPILQRTLANPFKNGIFTEISAPTGLADGVLAAAPPPSDLPTGIKLTLIDERGIYLALE